MRETELLPFDDSLLEANVPVLTHKIHQKPAASARAWLQEANAER